MRSNIVWRLALITGMFIYSLSDETNGVGTLNRKVESADMTGTNGSHNFSIGPFQADPVVAVYVVAGGRSSSGQLQYSPRRCMIVRFFDPAERLLLWRYIENPESQNTNVRMRKFYFGDGEQRYGLTNKFEISPLSQIARVSPKNGFFARVRAQISSIFAKGEDTQMSVLTSDCCKVRFNKAGIYQIRASGMGALKIGLDDDLPYGVSFQNGDFSSWDKRVARAYVFVPPHAETFQLCNAKGVQINDETGRRIYPDKDGSFKAAIKKTEVIWTFEFPDPGQWRFRAAGFPVILCPTREAAVKIRASVEELPDGTVVAHKFQRRIAELLPKLLAVENAGRSEELLKLSWNADREAWLAEPARNSRLLGSYNLFPMLMEALREQNMDPTSHWSGSIGAWKDKLGKKPPENRWDRFMAPAGCWSGVSPVCDFGEALVQAYLLNKPFNPFYGRKELLYRAAALSLRNLMALPEHETGYHDASDLDPYPGLPAFTVARQNFPEYGVSAPLLPDDVRAIWTEGLRRIIDRHYPDDLVSCMNQSSHFLVGWQLFAMGSADPRYASLARRYAMYFAANARVPGYFVEAMGPDATYCGMQHWHMAEYYRLSGGDPVILEAVRKSYEFFNHTVAPEPDGAAYGGCNFSHRTPGGFESEQWAGARGILDDLLPEVGLWAPNPTEPTEESKLSAAKKLERQLNEPLPKGRSPILDFPRYLYWTENPDKSREWPAMEKQSFIRDFGGELIAVKRPGYYAAVYAAQPAPDAPCYTGSREELRKPIKNEAENSGATGALITPFTGGGLTILWIPNYGNALLSGNFSPLCHHGLVAIDNEGLRWWENYASVSNSLDKDKGELTCIGRLEKWPVQYTRQYQFAADRIEVHLTLTAAEDVEFADLFEVIPIAGGEIKKKGAEIEIAGEKKSVEKQVEIHKGTALSDRFCVKDRDGHGLEVLLDSARELRVCRSGMLSRGPQINRVEIVLPKILKKNQKIELKYQFVPVISN